MKDKLRELAGDWCVAADAHDEIGFGAAAEVGRTCADELLAILDAEGDGRAVDSDGMCNEKRPERRCVCREEFGYRVCGKDQTAERIEADEGVVGSEWPYIEIVTLAWSKLRERDCLPEEWHEGDMVRALQAVWPKPPAQPTKLEDAMRIVANKCANDESAWAAWLELFAALQENAK